MVGWILKSDGTVVIFLKTSVKTCLGRPVLFSGVWTVCNL